MAGLRPCYHFPVDSTIKAVIIMSELDKPEVQTMSKNLEEIARADVAARLVQAVNLQDPSPQHVKKLFREMLDEVCDVAPGGEE